MKISLNKSMSAIINVVACTLAFPAIVATIVGCLWFVASFAVWDWTPWTQQGQSDFWVLIRGTTLVGFLISICVVFSD